MLRITLRWYPLIISLIILLFAGLVFLIARDRILLKIGDFLVVEDELQKSDIIHVIAGLDYRAEYAIELYQRGFGDQLFFTGGWCETHQFYHGQHARDLALQYGIPSETIVYDDSRVTSTYSEVERLREYIALSPSLARSVIVVSDPHHMRRARWTYREVLGKDIKIFMAPVPFEQTPYQRRWWEDEKSTRLVKDEYVKMIYYFARYKLSVGPIQDWLAGLDQD